MKKTNFDLEERSKIIVSIFQLRQVVEQLSNDLDDAADDEKLQTHLMQEYGKTLDELQALEEEYVSFLPKIRLSRCPFTNTIFELTIDSMGLDGPWWDAERPVRQIENEIQSYFALTGSIDITGEIPKIPFPVKPGPAVPWVSPRLLTNENIMAVLSHIKVGVYDAYVTVYYSNDKTVEIERINTWGTDEYFAEDKDGFAVSGSTYDDVEEYDFDIAPWIKKGKLKWISPDDKDLSLQDSVKDCPYLNLNGYRYPVIIRNGKLENCMIELEYDDVNSLEAESLNITPHFCSNCGNPVIKGAKFCVNCGNKLN